MKFDKLLNTIEEQMCHYGGVGILIEAHQKLVMESLFDIDEDVDYLFDKLDIEQHLKDYKERPRYLYDRMIPLKVGPVYSNELPSEVSTKADKINPVEIYLTSDGGSIYNLTKGVIHIAFNENVIDTLGEQGLDNKEMLQKYPNMKHELTPIRLKSAISHELTHWLEESLYKNKIQKSVDKVNKNLNRVNVLRFLNTSPQEIESFIHQIAQIKRGYSEGEWDKLSFTELFQIHASLRMGFRTASDKLPKGDLEEFSRTIIRKMNREGLLGKNMRTPKHDIAFSGV